MSLMKKVGFIGVSQQLADLCEPGASEGTMRERTAGGAKESEQLWIL